MSAKRDAAKVAACVSAIPANIRNLIFDLDGTLYPLRKLGRNLFFVLLRHPVASWKFYRGRMKTRKMVRDDEHFTSRGDFRRRQADCAGVSMEYFERKIYRHLTRRVFKLKPYRRAAAVLSSLREKGYRLFVYSDFPIDGKVAELGLEEFFEQILTSEDSGFLKPDVRGFEYIRSLADISPDDTMFVGDRIYSDVNFAKNCGMRFAVVGDTWKW